MDFDVKKHIKYWFDTAEMDWAVAGRLFDGKDYLYSLFFVHLSMEKILKGLVTRKISKTPPKIHNLIYLAEMAGLEINDETREFFDLLNRFQILTRYPDFRLSAYKQATRPFTKKMINRAQEKRIWLKEKMK